MLKSSSFAHIAQSVEHFLGKEEVTGSNPVMSSNAVWRRGRDTGKVSQKAHRKEKGGRSQRTEYDEPATDESAPQKKLRRECRHGKRGI